MTYAPIIRIVLRYLAGFLVARGFLTSDDGSVLASDADLVALIETGIGFVIFAGTEAWYWVSKKFGWKT